MHTDRFISIRRELNNLIDCDEGDQLAFDQLMDELEHELGIELDQNQKVSDSHTDSHLEIKCTRCGVIHAFKSPGHTMSINDQASGTSFKVPVMLNPKSLRNAAHYCKDVIGSCEECYGTEVKYVTKPTTKHRTTKTRREIDS